MKTIDIDTHNILEFPGVICFIKAKDPSFHEKVGWLDGRFREGLRIKAVIGDNGKVSGFIEYVPGKNAWRAVSCPDHMFIHCLWVTSKSDRSKGMGTSLINCAIDDARNSGLAGVAVLASNDAFMAKRDIFDNLGFKMADGTKTYQLLALDLKIPATKPQILDNSKRLASMEGWHVQYSRQCPWVARLVSEIPAVFGRNGLKVQISEIESAAQAQQSPSIYGAFCLVRNGKLLSERYISTTRLQNIIDKELDRKGRQA
jgi:hypothetical protein